MSLTNSPEIAEEEENKLDTGSGQESENEQKADTEIRQKETYLSMYLGSWETGAILKETRMRKGRQISHLSTRWTY